MHFYPSNSEKGKRVNVIIFESAVATCLEGPWVLGLGLLLKVILGTCSKV